MGSALSRRIRQLRARNERRLLVLGLDNAGKTTIVARLRSGQAPGPTQPTLETDVEELRLGRLRIHLWDVGGQEALRPLWRHTYSGAQGIIFVVDGVDEQRLPAARRELEMLAADEQLVGVPLVLLVNKRDMEGCLAAEAVCEALGLAALCEGQREWSVQQTVGTEGTGVVEGVEWLCGHAVRL